MKLTPIYRTMNEFINSLNLMSRSSFYRLLKEKNVKTKGRLLSPQEQINILIALELNPAMYFDSPHKNFETS